MLHSGYPDLEIFNVLISKVHHSPSITLPMQLMLTKPFYFFPTCFNFLPSKLLTNFQGFELGSPVARVFLLAQIREANPGSFFSFSTNLRRLRYCASQSYLDQCVTTTTLKKYDISLWLRGFLAAKLCFSY